MKCLHTLLCLVSVLLLLLCAGCSAVTKLDSVSFVLEAEPASLDPAKTTALAESIPELHLFEGLTRLDRDNVPQPALAERWDISPDGKTYVFHLRPGIRWSDGTPITAADFEYSWKRVADSATASENAYMMFPIVNAEAFSKGEAAADDMGVTAVDDRTLRVTLKNPTAYFLNLTAFHCYYPVPRRLVEEKPDTWAADAEGMIGCGPFVIKKWIHSSEITFEKNPQYWDADHVRMSHMEFPISDSQSTRLTLVESHQANMMVEPPPADQTRLEQMGLYKTAPFLGIYYYVFNVTKPPFDDKLVRKAFALSIQRQSLVQHIVRGEKQAAYAWVSPGMTDPATGRDFREEGGNLMTEDSVQAKEALQQAGYNEAHPLPSVTLLFNTSEMNKAIAESMQAMWKENLGVDVSLMNQETKVFMATRSKGDFQVARASWIGDYADPMTFIDVFFDEENDAQYHNKAYNAYVTAAKTTVDDKVRMEAMHKAEQILFDDYVIIPVYFTTQPYVVQPYVKGYAWSTLGTVDFKEAYVE